MNPVDLNRTLVAAFLRNVPANVYFKDKDGRFLAVSDALVRHQGLTSPAEMIGRTDFELFSAGHASDAFADEQRIIRTGEPLVGKLEREEWPDGRVTWVVTSKLPLRDAAGVIVGTFGLSKDITAERDVQASLEEARKDLADASRLAGMAEVATGVLHNVGNVLNSLNVSATVIGSTLRQSKVSSLARVSELLQEKAGQLGTFLSDDPKGRLIPGFLTLLGGHLAEERTRLLAEIESLRVNVDHIKDIVSMQQAYATMVGVVEPLAPSALMDDALRMNAAALSRHEIAVVKEYAEAPAVWAERGKVLQILINLIRNAKYALDERADAPGLGPRMLTLRIAPAENGRVVLAVTDNGVGIPAENLTRIFGHGFTTRRGGHGFGLHSSALAAKEMGGSLAARSAGPGRGASFTLELPAAAAGEKAA